MKLLSKPIPEKIKIAYSILLSIILTASCLIIYLLRTSFNPTTISILGLSFIFFGLFCLVFYIFSFIWIKKNYILFLLFFIISTSLGYPFLINEVNFLDFFFYTGLGVGISLLISGIHWKLFGLIIPGAIIIGITPGLYFAWENTSGTNPLEQTGIMLVWFAFGWGLITIFSRTLTKNFVWWPLIPGGILAVVGWGLYIAGNPESAVVFIGNTGSIGLIIFGIYILLMRRSFHQ